MHGNERTDGQRILVGLLGILFALLSGACATRKPVDFESYETLPRSPLKMTLRTLASTNSFTKHLLYHERYGGPGNLGGPPADEMDELYRRHDIVYYLADTQATMRASDRELIRRLKSVDTSKLQAHEERYRQRAINYFESPVAAVLGKPVRGILPPTGARGQLFPAPRGGARVLHSRTFGHAGGEEETADAAVSHRPGRARFGTDL